jgi:hypothetical protein
MGILVFRGNMGRFYIEEKLSEHLGETPEGFLICRDVPIAKIGEQIYKADEVPIQPNKDGLVVIKRREEEVFSPDAISSFEGKPFTIDHPDEMVTPENWKDLAHGFVTNVRRGVKEKLDLLVGDIVITTKKAIELVKNGMREISCGYDANYEQLEKGVGIQKDIIGNHIALVMRGRAGHRCSIGDKMCTNCGECKCKTNIKDKEDEEIMNFKTKLKAVYHKLIKDADFENLPDEEKVDKLVEAGSDAIEELPPEKKDVSEEGEVTIGQLNETVNRLIGIIEAFVKSASAIGTGDEDDPDKKKETEDEDNPDKKEKETEDEDLEKEEREKMEAKDCDSVWHDVAYRADLLSPGMRLNKPIKDHKSVLQGIKKKALKDSFTTDSEIISEIVKKDKIDALSVDAIDIAFIAASEAIKNKNNRMVRDSISSSAKTVTNDIRSIQERNKKFWGRK